MCNTNMVDILLLRSDLQEHEYVQGYIITCYTLYSKIATSVGRISVECKIHEPPQNFCVINMITE
jgi:hypothetical protein